MQNSIESNKKINKNINENNYNDRIMWKRMMSKHEISIASSVTKSSQKSSVTQWKNKMRIVNTNLK